MLLHAKRLVSSLRLAIIPDFQRAVYKGYVFKAPATAFRGLMGVREETKAPFSLPLQLIKKTRKFHICNGNV